MIRKMKVRIKVLFGRVLAIILKLIFPPNTTRIAGSYEKHCSLCERIIEHRHMHVDLSAFLYDDLVYVCLKCTGVTIYNMDPMMGSNILPAEREQIEENMLKLASEVPKCLPGAKKELPNHG